MSANPCQDGDDAGKSGAIAQCLADPAADADGQRGDRDGQADAAAANPTIRPSTSDGIAEGERLRALREKIEAHENLQDVLDELGRDPKALEGAEIAKAVSKWTELQEAIDAREATVPESEPPAD